MKRQQRNFTLGQTFRQRNEFQYQQQQKPARLSPSKMSCKLYTPVWREKSGDKCTYPSFDTKFVKKNGQIEFVSFAVKNDHWSVYVANKFPRLCWHWLRFVFSARYCILQMFFLFFFRFVVELFEHKFCSEQKSSIGIYIIDVIFYIGNAVFYLWFVLEKLILNEILSNCSISTGEF